VSQIADRLAAAIARVKRYATLLLGAKANNATKKELKVSNRVRPAAADR
jgi:hypothetical protein